MTIPTIITTKPKKIKFNNGNQGDIKGSKKFTDKSIIVNGWVKNRRGSKNVFFISLNDGSTIENLQIVCESESINEE